MPLAEPPVDLSGLGSFPARRLTVGEALYRIHGRDREVFWFSSLPGGANRYDIRYPDGACYTARSAVGAWLEVYRDAVTIELAELRARRLTTITSPRELDLADLTATRARGFGVTGDIHVMDIDDYRLPRAWAAALHTAGWRGLEGRVRHDPALDERTVTLFDGAGEHAPFDEEWPCVTRDVATDWDLHDEMQQRFGYIVAMPVPQDVTTTAPSPNGGS